MLLIEAALFRQGRSGASRDIAVAVLRRFFRSIDKIKIKCKASAAKAAGYFLVESNKRKVTKEVAFL